MTRLLGPTQTLVDLARERSVVVRPAAWRTFAALDVEDVSVPRRAHDERAVGADARLEQRVAVGDPDLLARLVGHAQAFVVRDLHAAEHAGVGEFGGADLG